MTDLSAVPIRRKLSPPSPSLTFLVTATFGVVRCFADTYKERSSARFIKEKPM